MTATGNEGWGRGRRAKRGSKVAESDLALGGEYTVQGARVVHLKPVWFY